MRRKILLVSVLFLLMLFAVAPLISLPVNAEKSAEPPKVETADVQPAATTIFTEGFETVYWPGSWVVGDWDSFNGYDYWGDANWKAHGGSWSGYCADEGTRETTIFTEDFEGAWPGSWSCGDWQPLNGLDYWGDNTFYKHGGGWSGWCADEGDHPYGPNNYDSNMMAYMYRAVSLSGYSSVTLSYWYFTDNDQYDYLQVMYKIGGSWYFTDTHTGYSGGFAYSSISIPTTANAVGFYFSSGASDKSYYFGSFVDDVRLYGIQDNRVAHKYDNGMEAYMYRETSLSGYSSVTLSYYYWLNSGPGFDGLCVMYSIGGFWHYVDGHGPGNSGGWQFSSVDIPTTATHVGFYFSSDYVACDYEGAYIDDVVLTGTTATYEVEIKAYCYTEGAYVSVPITVDGSPSGLSTPHSFYIYDGGTHTFTVPSTDASGHPFKQWYLGGTSTTITVSSAGTYYATYQAVAQPPTVEIWTDKATYARGETLKAYIQGFNPGPAVAVKVKCWFGLPGGGTYMLETYYTGTIPASYTSPVYTWKSVTIPTSAAVGTYSVNAEMRNPTTNALIDSDTYSFTIT
jgi:hypothetical protein